PQRWLWLIDQIDPGTPTYVVPWRIPLAGPLDRAALAAALATVVDRHEALRTSFKAVGGQPVQVIAPTAVPLDIEDLTGEPDPAAAADARAATLVRVGFRLDTGPML